MNRAYRPYRSKWMPAMLVGLVAIFFAVLFFTTWVDTRLRPPPPEAASAPVVPVEATAPVTAPQARAGPKTLHKCVAIGRPAVYTDEACPAGMRRERDIAVTPMADESQALRRAREQCAAAKGRERIELAKLGNRRSASDLRLWGDYVVRHCSAYTTAVEQAR
jgi:hypothetical protein